MKFPNAADRSAIIAGAGTVNAPTPPRTPRKNNKKNETTGQKTLLSEQQQLALRDAAILPFDSSLAHQETTIEGLTPRVAAERLEQFGRNEVDHDKPAPAIVQFIRTFKNPFIIILSFLLVIMIFTDIIWADPEEGVDYTGVITIALMVLVSASLRFWQEFRSGRSAEALKAMVRTTSAVTRSRNGVSVTREIPIEGIVPGDIIQLAAGDMIPADVRIIRSKDLQVNQSMLTGESLPTEKSPEHLVALNTKDLLEATNLGFMGTSVVSGSGTAVVLGTGTNSYFGSMSSSITGARPETSFDVGIRKVSFLLIRFMLVMVPVVFIINGITKDWGSAFLFGVTVAVGLTPEMLPLIVTANLAKGAQYMSRRKVIVKRLNSIQNLGAMDVLCTDKTGTLTEDRIVLERHLDLKGNTSEETLLLATANAHFQTGLRNLLDRAIIDAAGEDTLDRVLLTYDLVDEMPFDFMRRRMSVVVGDSKQHLIITKGAAEEVLSVCTTEQYDGAVQTLTSARKKEIRELIAENNSLGMRVLALATKSITPIPQEGSEADYFTSDESDMTLVGLLAFLDPPKASAAEAIKSLQSHGTQVKVITGDNELVAETVCRDVGIDVGNIVLGNQIEDLSDEELIELAKNTTVFAKINPLQKARIVESLRAGDHVVGFLGDGINDAAALRAADVGISVDTAVDIAKESADIILLEKDLTVLEKGVLEGRRTFGNTMKYIKMTASSNFGNMFSVLVASAMLPFIPMIPIVVLVQNLAYDLAMLTMPWDRVDDEYLKKPRKWETKSMAHFMIRIGPISSIFDITTFALMWFIFQANSPEHAALFQSGWFIESIISQTLIVHMIRTRKIPFIQSRASLPVMLATGAVCIFGLILPFTNWGASLGLVPLPMSYFPWLVATLLAYCLLTQYFKVRFVKKFDTWI
ncbi:magnesium-translocating P-type ATPase [Lysinibacter sp. HNR]|uniref:magnesium-translocating P-type ATPase n=1 Tax=Lysinibacter sp. HNR TaxID=3031408 RepID=UPI002434C5E1|nr:magnesium-translocating P-type ATPase [Lysinibacter sp. HNR]WGD37145.1 magnesium-translocating P-type ATPase [Lysinibacter sp. HNR]